MFTGIYLATPRPREATRNSKSGTNYQIRTANVVGLDIAYDLVGRVCPQRAASVVGLSNCHATPRTHREFGLVVADHRLAERSGDTAFSTHG
jgi:hypothetical protein